LTATIKNLIQEEIKKRLNPDDFCYYSFQNLLFSRRLPKLEKNNLYKHIILPVFLYGHEIWSLTSKEEHRLKVFERKVLGRIFGPKRVEETGDWRRFHSEELHNLYSSPSIIRMLKSRRMRRAGNASLMGRRYDIGGKARAKKTTRKTKTYVGGQY
jgi:hypothetical protein